MTVIVHIENNEPTGWITGSNLRECMAKLEDNGYSEYKELFDAVLVTGKLGGGKTHILKGWWVLQG